ncbi:hypothetical protein NDU88_003877 [Pleurodeles waltl]|uniref:Uncharacterized protein n=1 Tax=Pleurodeles waltl TaxID=8319 RepID=A0AAV7LPC7_PLEWA|nr:hypothetical protein NDU88_003877 [Pleurodeles waltl]
MRPPRHVGVVEARAPHSLVAGINLRQTFDLGFKMDAEAELRYRQLEQPRLDKWCPTLGVVSGDSGACEIVIGRYGPYYLL